MKKSGCATASLAIVTGLVICVILITRELGKWTGGFEEQTTTLEWLPSQATSVTFYEDYFRQIAEFSIDKKSFLDWTRMQNRTPSTITAVSEQSIQRALPALAGRNIVDLSRAELDQLYNKSFNIGDLFYSEKWDNNGGYMIGYDISEGKAYFWHASH